MEVYLKIKKPSKKGFTLVELIVVITIIVILAAIAIPVFSGYIKEANDAAAKAEARSVYTAAQVYVVQNNIETTPTGTTNPTLENAIAEIAEIAGADKTKIKGFVVLDGKVTSITYDKQIMPISAPTV